MAARSSSIRARLTSAFVSVKVALQDRGVFYFRRARVVCWSASAIDSEGRGIEVGIREASSEDLQLLAVAQDRDASDWLARRARGGVCLVAQSGPACLGYLWITQSAEMMTEVDHVLDVTRDAAGAYLFDGFVFPAHRRKGVLRALLASSKRWALHHGLTRLYAAFARDNRVSEHALRAAGFVTVVGDVSLLRLFGHERKWIRVPEGRPAADVLSAHGPQAGAPRPT